MIFENIDVEKHCDDIVEFRKDSFAASFGSTSNFVKDEYLHWLKSKVTEFPDGFVLVSEHEKYIGQIELTTREYQDRTIGYINLYYLIPEMRGKGKGIKLHRYAEQFFKDNEVNEYHLRVSPSNKAALNFYHKIGMKELGPEVDGKVIRMKGYV